MDAQKIQTYISKPDRILLGVSAALSQRLSISTVAIRLALLIITLFFIPFGLLIYLILYLALVSKKGKILTYSLIGALFGIPMSYYFQSELVQNWGGGAGIFGYLTALPEIMEEYHDFVGNAWSLAGNIVLSILVFALLGGAIGYFLEKNRSSNQS
ncbi:Phage shock protein PspC (stress-responsive transcriptional regulator) [Algoriphagus locisalis]|uniref:Phage shock protein PspC (Stress-responsive transcriptional regulator) n=1 Tax=Algoriphagus locisalis TaxID=305507 RepID=A0A1I6YJN0_9BACT|nr:PspC domain-containing protein [Algoriphagus locisalis]SFT50693.1 Phage shock protein PspC (stress-responsive transcriptional regulator) [Algoriphagus locisalis]